MPAGQEVLRSITMKRLFNNIKFRLASKVSRVLLVLTVLGAMVGAILPATSVSATSVNYQIASASGEATMMQQSGVWTFNTAPPFGLLYLGQVMKVHHIIIWGAG